MYVGLLSIGYVQTACSESCFKVNNKSSIGLAIVDMVLSSANLRISDDFNVEI